MVQLDPRLWHQNSLIKVHEANKSFKTVPLFTSNLRAVLTGPAALGTQVGVLLIKNTCIGAVGGVLRCIRLETNAPGWAEWKVSACKVAAYIKALWLSAWALPMSLFSSTPSQNSVIFHQQQGLIAIPEIALGVEQYQAKRKVFSVERSDEKINEAVRKKTEVLQTMQQEGLSCQSFKNLHDVLTPFVTECGGIVHQSTALLTLYYQWNIFFPTQQQEELKTFVPAAQGLLKKAQHAETYLKNCQETILKRQRDVFERGELFNGRDRISWEERWNKYSSPKETPILLQQKEELEGLRTQFLEFALFLEEKTRQSVEAWFEEKTAKLQVELAPLIAKQGTQLHQIQMQVEGIQSQLLTGYAQVSESLKQLYQEREGDLYRGVLYDAFEAFKNAANALQVSQQTSTAQLKKLKTEAQSLKLTSFSEVVKLIDGPVVHPLSPALEPVFQKMKCELNSSILWNDDAFKGNLKALWEINEAHVLDKSS